VPGPAVGAPYLVVHNEKANRFEVTVDGQTATLAYTIGPGVIDLQHTTVPVALRNKGLANTLAHAGLDYARIAKLKVIPTCPFVRAYIDHHPEYGDLLAR
jgi:predicted GNAT family acetyltransferase